MNDITKTDLSALTVDAPVLFAKTYGWYEFRQNNSGGSFHTNDDVSVEVLIQAASSGEADIKAEEIGIYFDGVEEGRDCDCCGNRWHSAGNALSQFTTYNWRNRSKTDYGNVRAYAQAVADVDDWAAAGEPTVIVYFADGTVERFYRKDAA